MLFKGGKSTEYSGSLRSTKKIKMWAVENMAGSVTNVRREGHMKEFLSTNKGQPHVLLFTDKYETSPLYKSLSWKHRKSMTFGEVRAKNTNFQREFPVGSYPALFVIRDGEDPIKYEGPIKQEAIDGFLKTQSAVKKTPRHSSSRSRRRKAQSRKAQTRGNMHAYSTLRKRPDEDAQEAQQPDPRTQEPAEAARQQPNPEPAEEPAKTWTDTVKDLFR